MKHWVLLAGVTLLAACGQKQEAEAPDAAATEAMPVDAGTPAGEMTTANGAMPGKYDVTAPDGTQLVSELKGDGTYQDWRGDKVVEKGTWTSKDGKTCFDPEGDQAETCYTDGARNPDGSFDATGPDGKVTKVKPHAA
jgi:hypothetical protein